MNPENPPEGLGSAGRGIRIQSPVGSESGVIVVDHPTEVHVYRITRHEIDQLAYGRSSLNQGLFMSMLSVFVTLLVVLLTVDLTTRALAVTAAALIAVFVLGVSFGFRTLSDFRATKRIVQDVVGGESSET